MIYPMYVLGIIFFLLVQAAKPAPPPDLPADPGVYYHQGGDVWMKLDPAVIADSNMKGLGLFIYTDGMTDVNTQVIYKGAHASMQIPDARPVLYVRGAGPMADASIIHLTQKKDARAVRTAYSMSSIDNKGGFKREEIRKTIATVYSDDSFSITPEADLKPGEYLIAFGYADKAYGFGIQKNKK
jgi:hypothetical protein